MLRRLPPPKTEATEESADAPPMDIDKVVLTQTKIETKRDDFDADDIVSRLLLFEWNYIIIDHLKNMFSRISGGYRLIESYQYNQHVFIKKSF